MNKFSIEIVSAPEKAFLVAEIWLNENLIAEISNEKNELVVEFFASKNLIFNVSELFEVLNAAKQKLLQ